MLELRPKVDWNKGSAVNWILDALDLGHRADVFPIYLGDDITDEDAFVAMETRCVFLSFFFGSSFSYFCFYEYIRVYGVSSAVRSVSPLKFCVCA